MTEVQDQEFANTFVAMDSKRFVRCRFSNCVLHYTGEQPCLWEKTTFDKSCVWKFDGCALNVYRVLHALGVVSVPLSDPWPSRRA